jgi:hypothetical protein
VEVVGNRRDEDMDDSHPNLSKGHHNHTREAEEQTAVEDLFVS